MTERFSHMDPALKARWIEALLSGDYKQGKGVLRNNRDEYCCLGVLCDIMSDEVDGQWTGQHSPGDTEKKFVVGEGDEFQYVTAGLPKVITEATGIEPLGYFPESGEHDGRGDALFRKVTTSDGGEYQSLSSMNDEGETFEEIARVIEENF